ncbi:MAG: ABC transporter permease [Sphaerochaetaceae bacterium]|nr:ABC transporter permease [Sphaerochaetaceae bacterium]
MMKKLKNNKTLKGILTIISLSLIILVVLAFLLSDEPLLTLNAIFVGPLSNLYYFGNTLNSMIPLMLGGLGILVALKCGLMNLGGEGQIYLGALFASIFAYKFQGLGYISIVIGLIAGFLISSLIAGISGIFKVKYNTSEMITSYLISVVVTSITNYLISSPYKDPKTNLVATSKIKYMLHDILLPSQLTTGIIYAVIIIIVLNRILNHTRFGYENRMVGYNKEFARYGGISINKTYMLSMLLSGGLHGLAGGFAIVGTYGTAIKSFSSGMGWNAIAIALIALNNPLGVIPAAFFFAWINQGTLIAMQTTNITSDIALIVQSCILFLTTSVVLLGDNK